MVQREMARKKRVGAYRIVVWGSLILWASCALAAAPPSAAAPATPAHNPSEYRPMLDKYCVGCHNQRLKTAGLMLDKADLTNVPQGGEVWEKVIRKLRGGS